MVYEHADDTGPLRRADRRHAVHRRRRPPDLLASIGFTREELADKLYDSLHDKLMTLPDATRVYPAHGAGSACGKNLSTDLWSTMGEQKATNYALRAPDKATFMEPGHRGPAAGTRLLRLRRDPQPQGPRTARRDQDADGHDLRRRCATRSTAGAVLVDGRTPGGVRARVICVARSTSASKAATPSSPDRCCRPTSTSCCSPSRVRSWRARTGWPASVSTG